MPNQDIGWYWQSREWNRNVASSSHHLWHCFWNEILNYRSSVWIKHNILLVFRIFSKMYICPSGSMRVTGCLHQNNADCNISVVRSPLDVSSTISITLTRKHNGAEFRCEAQLDLGPEGPQPPPRMMSSPINITVYCKITFTFVNTVRSSYDWHFSAITSFQWANRLPLI